MALIVKRSDKFPVGTSVKAFAAVGGENRHHEGQPSGTVLATETVAANGTLTYPTLAEGLYQLFAVVNGSNANMLVGSQEFTAPGTLQERIARVRLALGC